VTTLNIKTERTGSKRESIRIVLEGFGVVIVVHALGIHYIAPLLAEIFLKLPYVTIAMLSSSSLSPLIAITYLIFRVKFIPEFFIKKEKLLYLLSGVVMAWIAVFVNVLFLGTDSLYLREAINVPSSYQGSSKNSP